MTNNTRLNNEDVPATVAGFYYQALLACKELTDFVINDADDAVEVGIERGADVKVRINEDHQYSIEAKFYGSKFSKYSSEITHTIFNFYKNSFEDDRLIFATNVSISEDDISFSQDWNTIAEDEIDKYIQYVKFCLIKESLNNDDINTKYQVYKETHGIAIKSQKRTVIPLILSDASENITDYISLNLKTDHELKTFIRKFVFRYEQENRGPLKQFSINELKDKIRSNIQTYTSPETDSEVIMSKLIDSFFETTVEATSGDRLIYNFKDRFDYVSIAQFKSIVQNIGNEHLVFLQNEQFTSFLEKIDAEESTFLKGIDRLIENNEAEREDLKVIKTNYFHLRKILFQSIDLSLHRAYLSCFSVTKSHENDFAIIKLLQYLPTLVMCENLDASDLATSIDQFSNVRFNENKYVYKYSNYDNLEDYLNSLIANNLKCKHSIANNTNTPIIIDYGGGNACDEITSLSMTIDIANMGGTNDDLLYYRNCNYRCKQCLILKKYLNAKDKFTNCPGLNIE